MGFFTQFKVTLTVCALLFIDIIQGWFINEFWVHMLWIQVISLILCAPALLINYLRFLLWRFDKFMFHKTQAIIFVPLILISILSINKIHLVYMYFQYSSAWNSFDTWASCARAIRFASVFYSALSWGCMTVIPWLVHSLLVLPISSLDRLYRLHK